LSLVTPQLKLRFLTVPWSYTILVIPESITDALYKAALIVKRQSDAAIKKTAS
jgi:hypothetical protein